MTDNRVNVEDISKDTDQLTKLDNSDLMPLPAPLDKPESDPPWREVSDEVKENFEASLDNTLILNIPKPKSKEEEQKYIKMFLSGLEKLFTPENNWVFLQPFKLSMDHCAKCQTCSDSCHIYEASGQLEIYRPSYRAEVLRRIYNKYLKPGGKFFGKWQHGDIELNWNTIARLAELSYRCNLCRRCAQTCPIGVDNALIAREIRKIASQEMGIHPVELHDNGSMLQLKVGSSTGMNKLVLMDNMEFIDEDQTDRTGIDTKTPFDVEGADILLIHNAGEIMAWPENPGCFATIFNAAGLSWTMSSEALGFDNINYGVFYDDMQFARVALKHAEIARKLGVKKIVLGECGHAHKALTIIADKVLTGDLNVPRESCMPILRDIVKSGKIKFDKSRNDFPITLHDPCNYVRLMGIVSPQREVLEEIVPEGRFREMAPHGVENFCCGGGSGFAIMSGHNFEHLRHHLTGRRKFRQVLEAFAPELKIPLPDGDPEKAPKYVCAPCSNCKGQLRDIIKYYDAWETAGIYYSGLVELIVNAMVDVKPGFIDWEWH